ncbi:MAG: hypothetical protein G01um101429_299 [Parcubacteria group bacterium Gr01-1014_29]|nr:MAG: hypothetical protein G01um101429_299 [Parcubacteria group bacterium Gr01-1014_29]
MPKNNNYNHTELIWDGKFEESVKLPQKRAIEKIVLPFQTIEVINEPREGTFTPDTTGSKTSQLFGGAKRKDGWMNKLIWGDNKLVMSSLLKEYAGKINLIYIDPPFDVGADFSIKVKIGDEEITKEPSMIEEKAYRDTWGKGTNSYLQMIYERLLLMRELLAENGSIYVHLDWHIGHYVKVIMDEVFGKENFRNEIVWHYDQGARPKTSFGKKHDTIFWYSKSESYIFNSKDILVPFESGMTEWRYTKGGQKGKEMPEGKIPSDVWDIKLNAMALEHLGFSTQKPEALLERIINASSNENDVVADFFCGSGTIGAVAERIGRRWLMSDLGRFAIHTSRKRLMEIQRKLKEDSKDYYPFEILNLGKYERQHWQVALSGKETTSESKKISQYIKFIIELYRGETISGFKHIHGKKDNRFIHIGAVDAPVTINEMKEALQECEKNKFSHLDVLGWEWEMSLYEEMVDWAKKKGVRLKLYQIPREVMDKRAAEDGDVKFFELNYLEVNVEKKGQEVKVALKNFAIPSEDLIPNDLRGKIEKWSDYIDYWSVDWDYESLKSPEGESIFQNDWQAFRTKKNQKLELETPSHKYSKKGKYQILVKVIDIFGNDTSKVVEVKI